mmetsp:Transcript_8897/g.29444  ORF Transcript_8897/g.29444 Transcript_8897/m.29444 type:complete len:367 (-) Transcript_8897:156-1256(-)
MVAAAPDAKYEHAAAVTATADNVVAPTAEPKVAAPAIAPEQTASRLAKSAAHCVPIVATAWPPAALVVRTPSRIVAPAAANCGAAAAAPAFAAATVAAQADTAPLHTAAPAAVPAEAPADRTVAEASPKDWSRGPTAEVVAASAWPALDRAIAALAEVTAEAALSGGPAAAAAALAAAVMAEAAERIPLPAAVKVTPAVLQTAPRPSWRTPSPVVAAPSWARATAAAAARRWKKASNSACATTSLAAMAPAPAVAAAPTAAPAEEAAAAAMAPLAIEAVATAAAMALPEARIILSSMPIFSTSCPLAEVLRTVRPTTAGLLAYVAAASVAFAADVQKAATAPPGANRAAAASHTFVKAETAWAHPE